MIKKKPLGRRLWVYKTFEDIDLILQHLEFKVWEYPNRKVSNITLKINFFIKLVLHLLLRSKMPTIGIMV